MRMELFTGNRKGQHSFSTPDRKEFEVWGAELSTKGCGGAGVSFCVQWECWKVLNKKNIRCVCMGVFACMCVLFGEHCELRFMEVKGQAWVLFTLQEPAPLFLF